MSTGDIIRTSCNFTLGNGVQYQNVYHHIFDGSGGVSDVTVTTIVRLWAGAVYLPLIASIKSDVVVQLSSIDQVEWVTDKWEVVANIGTFTPVFVPSDIGEVCPNQVSPFMVFKTARPKSVGRKFFFPTMEGDQSAGIITPAVVAELVSCAATIVNDVTVDGFNVLHPGIPRVGVNDWLNFTAAVVTNLLGTQRRRRPGYGA